MSNSFTRSTKQRSAIIEILSTSESFFSAQEIHTRLRNAGSAIGLSTVYRTLSALARANEVDLMLREDGESLYRLCSQAHHHHLVCRGCGQTIEIQAEEVESWADEISKKHGFANIEHTLEIIGTCTNCAKNN